MYVDIPELHRCCCCIPARYGLLVWIYIKLMLCIITLIPSIIFMLFYPYVDSVEWFVNSVVAIPGLVVDIVMNIVALVGGHSKKVILLKAYYKYSIFSLVFYIIVFIFVTVMNFYAIGFLHMYHPLMWQYITWYVMVGFASVAVQFYMLLLLRSKVNLLASNCKFRFVNNAAETEAECAIDLNRTLTWNCPDNQCADITEGNRLQEDCIPADEELKSNGRLVKNTLEKNNQNVNSQRQNE